MCCEHFHVTSNTLLVLLSEHFHVTSNTFLVLRSEHFHAISNATLWTLSRNIQQTLGASLWTHSCNIEHAVNTFMAIQHVGKDLQVKNNNKHTFCLTYGNRKKHIAANVKSSKRLRRHANTNRIASLHKMLWTRNPGRVCETETWQQKKNDN